MLFILLFSRDMTETSSSQFAQRVDRSIADVEHDPNYIVISPKTKESFCETFEQLSRYYVLRTDEVRSYLDQLSVVKKQTE